MSTFNGFSEEDLRRLKSVDSGLRNGTNAVMASIDTTNIKRLDKIGARPKKIVSLYKLPIKQNTSEDAIESLNFEKCRLSLKPSKHTTSDAHNNNVETEDSKHDNKGEDSNPEENISNESIKFDMDSRKSSIEVAPDIVRGVTNYNEDELAVHKVKLEELQLKQKLMEEQNKKRKEMLAKALADRTKQTEEEVKKIEKIKKELLVLDGKFTQDVAVLRKKIDHACLGFAEAEKHYLKVEKEFLQAKINLQKEKERKELLTEHLCALITHNETRKAQKLETLMLQLYDDKKFDDDDDGDLKSDERDSVDVADDDEPVIVDGVDQRTGKMVEIGSDS